MGIGVVGAVVNLSQTDFKASLKDQIVGPPGFDFEELSKKSMPDYVKALFEIANEIRYVHRLVSNIRALY